MTESALNSRMGRRIALALCGRRAHSRARVGLLRRARGQQASAVSVDAASHRGEPGLRPQPAFPPRRRRNHRPDPHRARRRLRRLGAQAADGQFPRLQIRRGGGPGRPAGRRRSPRFARRPPSCSRSMPARPWCCTWPRGAAARRCSWRAPSRPAGSSAWLISRSRPTGCGRTSPATSSPMPVAVVDAEGAFCSPPCRCCRRPGACSRSTSSRRQRAAGASHALVVAGRGRGVARRAHACFARRRAHDHGAVGRGRGRARSRRSSHARSDVWSLLPYALGVALLLALLGAAYLARRHVPALAGPGRRACVRWRNGVSTA